MEEEGDGEDEKMVFCVVNFDRKGLIVWFGTCGRMAQDEGIEREKRR